MAGRLTRLPYAREGPIVTLAERIALTRFPDGRVEPEQIAEAEGIPFRYHPFPEEFDGVLRCEAGRFFIICNDRVHRRGSARSRFTFAHELGHALIPEHRAALISGVRPVHYSRTEFASDSPEEMEADCFAASLLMPETTFRRQAAALSGSGFERIEALADSFGTSLTATAYRALAFDFVPAPAAIFRWDQLGRPISRRMSEETARLRPDYLGLVDVPAVGTHTARALAGLTPGTSRGRSHVMNWFPKLSGYDYGDQNELHEEVKSLGQYGWMTLVYSGSKTERG